MVWEVKRLESWKYWEVIVWEVRFRVGFRVGIKRGIVS